MFDAIKAAVDKKELGAPASGSLIYMMSKEAYLTDQPPHNLNHLMYDLPRMDGAAWGANLPGVPIYFQQLNPAPITEFYVVMGNWSDGTARKRRRVTPRASLTSIRDGPGEAFAVLRVSA